MQKINWITYNYIKLGVYKIPTAYSNINTNHLIIRKNSPIILIIKKLVWPISKLLSDAFIDGFIEKVIGQWIKSSINEQSIF